MGTLIVSARAAGTRNRRRGRRAPDRSRRHSGAERGTRHRRPDNSCDLGRERPARRGSLSSLTPAGTTYLIFCYDYVMQDPADTQPGPDADIDLSAEAASRFAAAAGLVVDSAGG